MFITITIKHKQGIKGDLQRKRVCLVLFKESLKDFFYFLIPCLFHYRSSSFDYLGGPLNSDYHKSVRLSFSTLFIFDSSRIYNGKKEGKRMGVYTNHNKDHKACSFVTKDGSL